MKIGTDQYNTFDTMTMDCWNDRVYYEGKEFPAGHFAAGILNFALKVSEGCSVRAEGNGTLPELPEKVEDEQPSGHHRSQR